MKKQPLQVFVRVRPSNDSQKICYNINGQTLVVDVQRSKLSNAREKQQFIFNRAFTQNSTQQSLFHSAAKPVIDNCLDGYNGTIFAYGQTGSGKTYTMSGGQNWNERGIIPRVINYVFEQFQSRSNNYEYSLGVTFVEIYNENAYDLLDESHSESNFQNWSKIIFMEDQDSSLKMKNVETHLCFNQEEAFQYLMMGNYNRKVNSTNLNQVSSRSHCIFTLNICGKNKATLAEVYSKIHLVDLAGSQRVSKSQAQGIVLTQAKSINLSLTYLEQVIVALNQKSKSNKNKHIPYRNSLLTTLLKDSLGGNCRTVMVATIATELSNIDETISTLRFSQRVRQIQNQVSKNEKIISNYDYQALERQNTILRQKLQQYEKQNQKPQNKIIANRKINDQELRSKVETYLRQKNTINLQVNSINQAQFCFAKMKQIYNKKMREYAMELTFISEKLQNYDEILTRREQSSYKQSNQHFNI